MYVFIYLYALVIYRARILRTWVPALHAETLLNDPFFLLHLYFHQLVSCDPPAEPCLHASPDSFEPFHTRHTHSPKRIFEVAQSLRFRGGNVRICNIHSLFLPLHSINHPGSSNWSPRPSPQGSPTPTSPSIPALLFP